MKFVLKKKTFERVKRFRNNFSQISHQTRTCFRLKEEKNLISLYQICVSIVCVWQSHKKEIYVKSSSINAMKDCHKVCVYDFFGVAVRHQGKGVKDSPRAAIENCQKKYSQRVIVVAKNHHHRHIRHLEPSQFNVTILIFGGTLTSSTLEWVKRGLRLRVQRLGKIPYWWEHCCCRLETSCWFASTICRCRELWKSEENFSLCCVLASLELYSGKIAN